MCWAVSWSYQFLITAHKKHYIRGPYTIYFRCFRVLWSVATSIKISRKKRKYGLRQVMNFRKPNTNIIFQKNSNIYHIFQLVPYLYWIHINIILGQYIGKYCKIYGISSHLKHRNPYTYSFWGAVINARSIYYNYHN